ncbi:2-nitropropane dioxygenase [Mycobacterium colombiense]|uniref:NAD(P)H-dependent flavin oxidoreductase n=1 Tax=Mycobacterium colombiense TaxID=339268 RepID=UPI0007EF658D|nr:2-nitropropane dioxygenase [Mycobacterium colombiense]
MAAPMSIASTPALVGAACRNGVVGCFPTHNAWRDAGLAGWIDRLIREQDTALAAGDAWVPFAVNINVSRAKPKDLLAEEIDICRRAEIPVVTTNVGNPTDMVQRVHDWGGIVIHDATTVEQAEKAVAAGVDGLMLVCAGAGGLGGELNPFAFVDRVRGFFDGIVQLAGGISTGRGIAAAQVLGADMVCMGTRFIATKESGVADGHKQMLIDADIADILWTDAISGIGGNFLRPSITLNGLDPDALPPVGPDRRPAIPAEIKPWKMVWSAGHCVGAIRDVPTVADLIDALDAEYRLYSTGPTE